MEQCDKLKASRSSYMQLQEIAIARYSAPGKQTKRHTIW
jgi:hypothetical protein